MAAHAERFNGPPSVLGRLSWVSRWTRGDPSGLAGPARRPPLARGERVLAAEPDVSGTAVVATTAAVYQRDPSVQEARWRRLALEYIGRLRWDPVRGVLDLTSFAAEPIRRLTLHLRHDTRIAVIVKERLAAIQIVGTRVLLNNGGTALVTARRRPDAAELIWVVLLDDNADPADAATHARVDSAIRELRALAGL